MSDEADVGSCHVAVADECSFGRTGGSAGVAKSVDVLRFDHDVFVGSLGLAALFQQRPVAQHFEPIFFEIFLEFLADVVEQDQGLEIALFFVEEEVCGSLAGDEESGEFALLQAVAEVFFAKGVVEGG